MAIILKVNQLKKEFGEKLLFENITFSLTDGDKVGLIGPNGAGKTSLFKCLIGDMEIDGGSINIEPVISIGYMEQIPDFGDDMTLMDAILSSFSDIFEQREQMAQMEKKMSELSGKDLEILMKQYGTLTSTYESVGGFNCETKAKKVLNGLGFTENETKRLINSFSGGEKTKINLACLLAREHQIMLLDEPTNHLDLESIEWLEEYLSNSKSTLLIISHDRYFLDAVTNKTMNLSNKSLKLYDGNYSIFTEKKAAEDLAYERAYNKQQKEIEETEAYIDKYRAGIKSKQARGRQLHLNKIERLNKANINQKIKINTSNIDVSRSGYKVLSLDKIAYSYPGRDLFENINEEISFGDRIALIGPNGAGKSTLLKIITGELQPKDGNIIWGAQVKIGYFDQAHDNLSESNTVLDEIINSFDITLQEARNYLGSYLFQGDDIYKYIQDLSGGERARLLFLKLYLENANFLILDEPTNHMDIHSREIFEQFLTAYEGTILTVSHDRYFLDAIATKILELNNQTITEYFGNFTEYKVKKKQKEQLHQIQVDKQKKNDSTNSKPNKDKNNQSRSWRAKTRQQISDLEKEIDIKEERLAAISNLMAKGDIYQGDPNELKTILNEYEELEKIIPIAYDKWETLSEELAKETN